MAVSDFTFKKDKKLKLKSNDPEGFIEYMKKTITKTPKVLSFIKKWNPNCKLISFKFEVGLEHNELINIAKDSMNKNNSDVVISNDNEEMTKHKNHVAYFLTDNLEEKIEGKENIAKRIYNYVIDGK
jgi:phosphopantothenate-cysteine ligase